jgi:tRNA-(ms[2]io[6]A)-hydroxylase
MAEDHHVSGRASQLFGGVVADVHEQETLSAQLDACSPAHVAAPESVDVPGARGHRSDGAQLLEHLRAADVPGVEDVIDARECSPHLGPEQAVRIRDDADPHASSIQGGVELLCETPRAWVELAIDRFDEVLVDHAHCEKKAAAHALSMLAAFPAEPGLARAMARLAREEAGHLAQVLALVEKRGLSLGRDAGDPYAQGLQAMVRQPARERLLDRLLISALIEARSEERLRLLGDRLPDPELRRFYARLSEAEKGHRELFWRLARNFVHRDERFGELAREEARLVRDLPLRPAIH